jgi:4'-phosphopantetheinyl transferase EntD
MTSDRPPIPAFGAPNETLITAASPAPAIALDFPGLIEWSRGLYPAGLREVGIYLIGFRSECFLADAYRQADMPLPSAIARSVQKRQAEHFYGRLAARLALADLGVHAHDIGSGADREPIWPEGVIGSITHGPRQAAAAALPAGPWRGVGIDLEGAVSAEAIASVEQLALCVAERAMLRQIPDLPHNVLVSLAFSAKESFYKATFGAVGHYFGFEAIRIDTVDLARRCLHFTTMETLCDAWPSGKQGCIGFTLLETGVLTAFAWK